MLENLAFYLSIMNIIAGTLVAVIDFYYWIKYRLETWRWIKLYYAIVGFYWALLYTYVLLASLNVFPQIDSVTFGRVFFRPAITITLSAIAAGAIIRMRRTHG